MSYNNMIEALIIGTIVVIAVLFFVMILLNTGRKYKIGNVAPMAVA